MKFINPKTDFAFKKIFGSPQSKDILISFLNAILYDGEPTVKDLKEKWMFFLKYCEDMSEIPEPYNGISEFSQAFEIANKANMSEEELEDLERREIYIQDQIGAKELAFRKGKVEGRQEGISEMIILQLSSRLGAIAPEIEQRITQLSAEQLQNLAVAFLNFSSSEDLIVWLDNLS